MKLIQHAPSSAHVSFPSVSCPAGRPSVNSGGAAVARRASRRRKDGHSPSRCGFRALCADKPAMLRQVNEDQVGFQSFNSSNVLPRPPRLWGPACITTLQVGSAFQQLPLGPCQPDRPRRSCRSFRAFAGIRFAGRLRRDRVRSDLRDTGAVASRAALGQYGRLLKICGGRSRHSRRIEPISLSP
jgi:hypothetical protein